MFSKLATPDTLNYMIAGYAVIFGAALAYIASLAIRYRKAKREWLDWSK
ncbi:MAG: hypothetical protein MAG431_01116 [Chloroflexi bacterium]|nr:hypothetical protein [Chloroflexota bacterium]